MIDIGSIRTDFKTIMINMFNKLVDKMEDSNRELKTNFKNNQILEK
jgi:hypothetical protein